MTSEESLVLCSFSRAGVIRTRLVGGWRVVDRGAVYSMCRFLLSARP